MQPYRRQRSSTGMMIRYRDGRRSGAEQYNMIAADMHLTLTDPGTSGLNRCAIIYTVVRKPSYGSLVSTTHAPQRNRSVMTMAPGRRFISTSQVELLSVRTVRMHVRLGVTMVSTQILFKKINSEDASPPHLRSRNNNGLRKTPSAAPFLCCTVGTTSTVKYRQQLSDSTALSAK